MTQFVLRRILLALVVGGISGMGATAFAEEAETEEEADDEEIAELLGEDEADEAPGFEPTFGFGLETGVFFTELARFNDYVLAPNGADPFDIWGVQHIDLALESVVIENIRLSLLGGVAFPWHSDPSAMAWYVGLEPAFVAGDDVWELGVGVSAAVGALTVTTGEEDRLQTSLTMLRPFVEARRHLSDSSAAYVRFGFNQWYPRNPRSETLDLPSPTGNRPLSTVDISTGGVYVALGFRFGSLKWQVEEIEEEEEEPECTRETVEEACTEIPDAVCEEGVLRTYQPICSDGECEYQSTETRCARGTECGEEDGEAACVPEPECREDGDCDNPPAPVCEDRILRTFGGVCEDGECSYEPSEQECPEGYECGLVDGAPACVDEPEEVVVEVDEEAGRIELREMIFFETGSDEIDSVSFPLLNQLARVLNENPQVERVRIEGHTDNRGGAEFNMDLSERRAASVKEALIGRGVEEGRLTSQGFGLTRPIADNNTEEGRAENRRVEFHITDAEEEGGDEEEAE